MALKSILQLLFFLVVLCHFPSAAQEGGKYGKVLSKADLQYEEGNYRKANKTLEKYKNKVVKKYGARNEYLPLYYMRRAKFNLAEGLLFDFENSIDQALKASESIYGAETKEHALTQMAVADIVALYGNFNKAETHVREAEKTLNSSGALDDNAKAKIDLTLASILVGRGFYNEALTAINNNIEYFQSRAVTKKVTVDPNGKIKTVRLSEKEVKDRLGDFARLLTLKANVFRKKGNYNSADSAFSQARSWIDNNLGNTSLAYVENQLRYGQLLVENGLEEFNSNVKDLRFEKSLSLLKRNHEESHYLAFTLYELLLQQYLASDNKAKYRNLKVEYEKAIKKNFKSASLHRVNLETVEFNAKLNRDKTKNLENQANAVIGSRASLPANHKKRVEVLEFLYRLALQKQRYTNAEQYMANILDIKKNLYGEGSPEYHLSKIEYANYLIDHTDKITETDEIYSKSFNEIVKPQIDSWHKDYLTILNHLSKFYEFTDQYDLANKTLTEAKTIANLKYDDKDKSYGAQLNEMAHLQLKIGAYEKADENISKAVEILKNQRKDEFGVVNYISALETEAQLRVIQGLFDEAEDVLDLSARTIKRVDIKTDFNDLASNEAKTQIYIPLGKYTETNELANDLIKKYQIRYGQKSRRLLNPLITKAKLELINGDYPKAEKTARRAHDIAVQIFGDKSSKTAPSLIVMADINTNIGDYEKAESNISKAIELQQKQFGKNHVDVGKSMTQLGLIKFYKGDNLREVEKIMLEAKGIIEGKLGNRNPTYADLITDLAKVHISQRRFDDAFNELSLAEKIWVTKAGKRNNINAASIYTLQGDIYYLQRNYDKAEEEYEKARKLYLKFFNKTHPEYVKVLSKLSKVYYMEGDTKKSRNYIEEALVNHGNFIKAFFPALSEREKAKFWNTIKPDFEFYNTLAFKLRGENSKMIGQVFNNALLTKAILLNSSIKIRERILSSDNEELKTKYNDWLIKKERLAVVLSMSETELAENQINPHALNNEIEQLEKQLGQQSELFSKNQEENQIVWENVQGALKPNEVAVEMVRYRYFDHVFTDSIVYAAMYVKNKSVQQKPDVVLLGNGRQLEIKNFKYYRNSIIFKLEDAYSYAAYWEPLRNVLGANSTIYLSADGVYNQLNLEAIPTGDQKYVIDNSNIILVSNTKDIFIRKNTTRSTLDQKSASMFGNPNFYLEANAGQINSLPGTARELSELNGLLREDGWSTDSHVQLEASEDEIKKLNNPKVFHIATHGFFKPARELSDTERITQGDNAAAQNPLLRTGLLLSGAGDLLNKTAFNYNLESGILTAYEAMNLNLDQTELVVLSACETGLGELAVGEGVYGLQRAFLVAGAKVLIMSMFKVDDEATQKLMTKFYKKWLETGQMRESFVSAKKELRNEYRDPIYWGAFIMIGLD